MGTAFDLAFQHELARNIWTMYAVAMVIVGLRFYAQLRRSGIRGFNADDYVMVVAVMLYTTLIASLNIIVAGGGSNLFLPEEYATFTSIQIKERILGSKIVVLSEQAMLTGIYSLKACLLIMYARLTNGTTFKKWVKYLSVYVVIGWVSTEIAFFTACTPFAGYWAVPPPNPQCTTLQHYAIVQATFNISSDLAMLFIPIPMFISLRLPLKQKVVLCGVFSLGIFVITAAILTKVFNLSDVYNVDYMLWYTREASVAVYVANLPLIWPLLREWVPFLRNTTYDNSYQLPSHESRRNQGRQGGNVPPSQGYATKHTHTGTSVSFDDILSSRTLWNSKTPEASSITTMEKPMSPSVFSPTRSSLASNSIIIGKDLGQDFSTPTRTSHVPKKSTDSRTPGAISTTRPSNEFVKQMERVREEKRNSGILTYQKRSSGWGQHGKIKTLTTIDVGSDASLHGGLGDEDYTVGGPMGFGINRALHSVGETEVKVAGPQISHL